MAKEPKSRSRPATEKSPPAPATEGQGEAERASARATPWPPLHFPPQGEGAPMRRTTTGSPATVERLNVAMKVLLDPLARNSRSKNYSGQRRSWGR